MSFKKARAENVAYVFCTLWTMGGLALCLAGLLVPNWYERNYLDGISQVRIHLGLWQDKVCSLGSCKSYWLWEDEYTRTDVISFPHHERVKILETIGCALGALAFLSTFGLWATRSSSDKKKNAAQVIFFTFSGLAGFITIAGTLILASKLEEDSLEWGPIITGVGGALFFLSGCLSCIICRYDPSYGTLENPVLPAFQSA